MTTQRLDIVRSHFDNMEAGDLDASLRHFSPDVETVTPGGVLKGIEEFRGLGETFGTAMSEMRHEIVRSYEVGDTVVVEGVFSGRHTGPMATPEGEIPPSGNQVSFTYADFWDFAGDLCVAHRIYWDNVALMAQLGAF
jgi:ketosteroid isomerase-like protein